MADIKAGRVIRSKSFPELRVWIVGETLEVNAYTGIALVNYFGLCDSGDIYTISKCRIGEIWEVTDEFYDVAEVVTKMQE